MAELSRSPGVFREPGPPPFNDPDQLEDELDVGRYLDAIQRRWKLVLGGALLGAILGAAISFLRPTLYEGVTTLLVTPPPKAAAQVSPATFRAILENATLASQVITELQLEAPPHYLTPQRFLENALEVEEVRGTNVVKVRVRLRTAALAAEASRRLAQKALTLTQQLNEQEGSSVQHQLKNHLDDAAARMATAEKELLAYQQSGQVELLQEDTKSMLEERGDLLELTISIESEKARLAAAETEIKGQERTLSVPRNLGAEEALRRTDRTSEVLDTSNAFVNPVYQSLEYEISLSRAKLAALEQERRQIVDVKKLGGEELSRLSELYRRQIELARLQTTFDLTKRVYSDLQVRYDESRTEALGTSPQLQLVDVAIPPDSPVSRRAVQSTALGLAAGLVVAVMASLVLTTREGRKRRVEPRP